MKIWTVCELGWEALDYLDWKGGFWLKRKYEDIQNLELHRGSTLAVL